MEQDQNYNLGQNSILNKRGQAAVEYILLLVIIVSLVMGAKTAFNSLDKFINHYIGDYVVCLMEYGELPSLGVSDSTLKKHMNGSGKSCDEEFAGFTFEDGRPPTGGGGGGGSGASGKGKGNSSSNNGSKNSSSNANKSGSEKGSDSESGLGNNFRGRKNGGGGKSSSPYTRGTINRSNSYGTADASDSDGKVRVIEDDKQSNGKGYTDRSSYTTLNGARNDDKYRAITGAMLEEFEKEKPKKDRGPAVSTKKVSGDEGSRIGPYKKVFIPPAAKKTAEKEDDNSGFGFGYIIRWLLIAGMILAIIVFFGGQIMNYSNSND